jgi:DNA-binding NtrC family response regulator
LVVEDDPDLLAAIVQLVQQDVTRLTHTADSVATAIDMVRQHKPRLVVCDVYLKDGLCHSFVKVALAQTPLPAIVAISGRASAEEAFSLAALGIRSYLAKPLSLAALRAVLAAAPKGVPLPIPAIAAQVGSVPIDVVKRDVRVTMLRQGLALTAGNRTECARILGITRQAVQHMIRELHIDANEFT